MTKDGSEIREPMHPLIHGNRRQDLVEATGAEPLRILCCCSPPCSHEDSELVEDA